MKKIAIVGASGFVGSHFFERTLAAGRDSAIPIIHSSGSAWRVARWGEPLRTADLQDKGEIADAITGCTHVVNCSRGDDAVMVRGLANLLEVCTDAKVEGFVHLSSVMVYGDPPSTESVSESGTVPRNLSGYGAIKSRQDEMVMAAGKNLPSAILCPPNITGPYSPYLVNLIGAIRRRQFALMDEGSAPCVVVDVDNLCHAIDRALEHCSDAPRRFFITDLESTTWSMVTGHLAEYAGVSEIERVSETELRRLRATLHQPSRLSISSSIKHLASSEVRNALRNDPLLAKLDAIVRKGVARLGSGIEHKLRLSIEGTPAVPHLPHRPPLNITLCAQQLRGVRHSCELARRVLGYDPPRSFEQSTKAFDRWYRNHAGMDSGYWELLRLLLE